MTEAKINSWGEREVAKWCTWSMGVIRWDSLFPKMPAGTMSSQIISLVSTYIIKMRVSKWVLFEDHDPFYNHGIVMLTLCTFLGHQLDENHSLHLPDRCRRMRKKENIAIGLGFGRWIITINNRKGDDGGFWVEGWFRSSKKEFR